MKHILRCIKCGKYTMKPCCAETISTKPARYAPQKFAKYRKEARKEDLQKRGLL